MITFFLFKGRSFIEEYILADSVFIPHSNLMQVVLKRRFLFSIELGIVRVVLKAQLTVRKVNE